MKLAMPLLLCALAGGTSACKPRMVDPYQDDDVRSQRTDIPISEATSAGRDPVTTTTGRAAQGQ